MSDREPDSAELEAFWSVARTKAKINPLPGYFGPTPHEALMPPAWAFGGEPEQADRLLQLVLTGVKTATSSALWDYEHEEEPLPTGGQLSILLDGDARPRALVEVTDVVVVPFDEVDAEHARLEGEGEGEGSLEQWRADHELFFAGVNSHGRPFAPDMPVVLERFRIVHPRVR